MGQIGPSSAMAIPRGSGPLAFIQDLISTVDPRETIFHVLGEDASVDEEGIADESDGVAPGQALGVRSAGQERGGALARALGDLLEARIGQVGPGTALKP